MLNLKNTFLGFFILILLSISLCSGCQQQEEKTYTNAQAKAFWEISQQLWNGGNVNLVDSLYAEGCVRHNADVGDANGPEGVKKFVKWVYTAYPDFKVTFDDRLELKDRMITRWTATGTNDGPLSENMQATGKMVSFTGISMAIIENGKITEEWAYYNQLPIYSKMGYQLVMKEGEAEKD